MGKLDGKVAVVTGASKGIGAAIARYFGAEGASVVVNYASSKEGADRVVNQIVSEGGKAIAVQGDVSKQEDITRLFAETTSAYGPVDVLVNNAGVYEFAPLEGITSEHYHKHFDINVLGLILTTKEAAANFSPNGGSIINISSVVSELAPPNVSVYSATKGAVDTITKSLAKELAGRKIRVNAINPGAVDTEGANTAGIIGSDFEASVVAQTPLGRIGRPEDIAPVAVFFASADSGWITGETINVAGGFR